MALRTGRIMSRKHAWNFWRYFNNYVPWNVHLETYITFADASPCLGFRSFGQESRKTKVKIQFHVQCCIVLLPLAEWHWNADESENLGSRKEEDLCKTPGKFFFSWISWWWRIQVHSCFLHLFPQHRTEHPFMLQAFGWRLLRLLGMRSASWNSRPQHEKTSKLQTFTSHGGWSWHFQIPRVMWNRNQHI